MPREIPEKDILKPKSDLSEYFDKKVLPIYAKRSGITYAVSVEEADIYTWVFTRPEIDSELLFHNVYRCWAMKRGLGASHWLDWEVLDGVDAFKKVLLKKEKFKHYMTRWNHRSMHVARACAEAECGRLIKAWYLAMVPCVPDIERVPKHLFDTITMARRWLNIRDEDVAITVTFLYHTDGVEGVLRCPNFDLTKDLKEKEVHYLQGYYESFFPGDNDFNWWRKNNHNTNNEEVYVRLRQLPWLARRVGDDFFAKEDGRRIFKFWRDQAKKWAAQRGTNGI